MKQETRLSLIQINDEILDAFDGDKEKIKQALDSLVAAWALDPRQSGYSLDFKKSVLKFRIALIKQIDMAEYSPAVNKIVKEIEREKRLENIRGKISKNINFPKEDFEICKN